MVDGDGCLINYCFVVCLFIYVFLRKIAALWIPICTFITLGLEHSVANMYILPLGMALGANIGVLDITANLVPVALGNAVGAGLMLGGVQRLRLFGPKAFKRMGR